MGSETKFLNNYKIEDYERPSVTTDVVVFTMGEKATENYRRNPEKCLSVLLVKRGEHPYKGCWALPGGFLQPGETVEQCALREIREETHVEPTALLPTGVYSEAGRDPRGWIISNAYASVVGSNSFQVKGDDDASEAKWFELSFSENADKTVELTLANGELTLRAKLKETGRRFDKPIYEITDGGFLAFDHAKIIASSLTALRHEAKNTEILFDFLPEKFTLSQLQEIYETIHNISVLTANFRRKIAEYVIETDEIMTGAGHRPAKLYKRKE